MEFRIADTFIDSLTRLTAEEQKAAKTSAFDLQVDPSHPGLQLHKLERRRDPNFLSVRPSKDIGNISIAPTRACCSAMQLARHITAKVDSHLDGEVMKMLRDEPRSGRRSPEHLPQFKGS